MKNNSIRWVVAFGSISIIGMIIIQVFWVRRALSISEKELNQTLHIALLNVAKDMAEFNNHQLINNNPVNQLSPNYFVVDINDQIDANILEHYLRQEFESRNIQIDYEYGIYDWTSNQMMYGNYIGSGDEAKSNTELTKWKMEFITSE